MGDKTQLATIALAAKYIGIFPVWLGTTIGMIIADAIGIIFGIVLGKNVPERWSSGSRQCLYRLWGYRSLWDDFKPLLGITGKLNHSRFCQGLVPLDSAGQKDKCFFRLRYSNMIINNQPRLF